MPGAGKHAAVAVALRVLNVYGPNVYRWGSEGRRPSVPSEVVKRGRTDGVCPRN